MGVVAAIACRWIVWPQLGSEAELPVALLPFILCGALLTGFPRLQVQSFDYNMVVLLLLQPSFPLAGTFSQSLVVGAAVASAPLVGWIAFRLIHPPSAARRPTALLGTMVDEVQTMATRPHPDRWRAAWQTRLNHRLLRLVRWSARLETEVDEAVSGGLALLLVGRAVLVLRTAHSPRGSGAAPLDAPLPRRRPCTLRRAWSRAGTCRRRAVTLRRGPPAQGGDVAATCPYGRP